VLLIGCLFWLMVGNQGHWRDISRHRLAVGIPMFHVAALTFSEKGDGKGVSMDQLVATS
jgi:hypothetical protein